jgi:predicted Zn-dependent protease
MSRSFALGAEPDSVADGSVLSRDEAQALCGRVLESVTEGEAEVIVRSARHGHTRFAANRVTTSGDSQDLEIALTVRLGAQAASVRFNDASPAAIRRARDKAVQLVRLAPEDPERMPLLGPQTVPEVPAYFDGTAALEADVRVEAVRQVTERAQGGGVTATGFLERRVESIAVANTAGLFLYHSSTVASFTTTVRTSDDRGSGWAGTTHNDWSRMTRATTLVERALEKARQSADARPVEPGRYTVLLEATAAGNLLQLLAGAFDGRAASEGRSAFARGGGATRVGERVADPRVTLVSDPADPLLLTPPFTSEGLPLDRRVWIERGVLRRLSATRFWARRTGGAPVPIGGGLRMEGTDSSLAELMGGVERGLLITRFWYIRGVDQRSLSYTGLTRDGVFLIERGQVSGAVRNLRFNDSVLDLLDRIERIGTTERVVASESGGLGLPVAVPALVVRDFQFTAVSDAV